MSRREVSRPSPGFAAVIDMPFGRFGIACDNETINGLVFLPPTTPLKRPAPGLALRAAEALQAWVDDPHGSCDLPLAHRGTAFQQRVWAAISTIPRGEVRTYGFLARALQSAPRAVGGACRANPFPLIVPCHRVVSGSGQGGFAGATAGYLVEVKKWLLAHETGR